jgi:hypothetical protein
MSTHLMRNGKLKNILWHDLGGLLDRGKLVFSFRVPEDSSILDFLCVSSTLMTNCYLTFPTQGPHTLKPLGNGKS